MEFVCLGEWICCSKNPLATEPVTEVNDEYRCQLNHTIHVLEAIAMCQLYELYGTSATYFECKERLVASKEQKPTRSTIVLACAIVNGILCQILFNAVSIGGVISMNVTSTFNENEPISPFNEYPRCDGCVCVCMGFCCYPSNCQNASFSDKMLLFIFFHVRLSFFWLLRSSC